MKDIIFDLGEVIPKYKPISVINDIDNDVYNELKIFFDDWDDLDLGKKSLVEKYNQFNFFTDLEVINSIQKELSEWHLVAGC